MAHSDGLKLSNHDTKKGAMPMPHKSLSPRRVSGFSFPLGAKHLTAISLPPSRRSNRPPVSLITKTPDIKVLSWENAHNSRPQLSPEMDGPGPQHYNPPTRPLNETNAPCVSFGRRTWPEKDGGSRASWQKPWFNTPHIWFEKVDFQAEQKWPSPTEYNISTDIGKSNPTRPQPPSWSFGKPAEKSTIKLETTQDPAPNHYHPSMGEKAISSRSPAYSHSGRIGGTQLWPPLINTPGPGRYHPQLRLNKPCQPGYSMQGTRNRIDYTRVSLGPFCAFG